jgi:MarR family transcriptional regulator, organic hydroperoxide resistance regulator
MMTARSGGAGRRRAYFHVQAAAVRLKAIADERCLAAVGVTAAQAAVLFVIVGTQGISQRGIAEALRQRESAVTAMIGRLIRAGLVERKPNPRDARAWELYLTGDGRHALSRIELELGKLNDQIDSAVGAGQMDRFVDNLEALAELEK